MAESVTIDNLGPEFHNRYAADQQFLDPAYTREARGISAQVSKDMHTPLYSNELGTLLGLTNRPSSWSLFSQPEGFGVIQKNLFQGVLVPSLGSDTKQQQQLDRIKETLQTLRDQKAKLKGRVKNLDKDLLDDEEEEDEQTGKALAELYEFLDEADRSLQEIIGRTREFTAA